MDSDPTAQFQWRYKSMAVLKRVTSAKRKLSASLNANEVDMLEAADELEAASRDAAAWMAANACPDVVLGTRVAWMLKTCTEAALISQSAVTDPSTDTELAMGRLEDLLAIIDIYSQTLGAS
jgi:hypothetical protein